MESWLTSSFKDRESALIFGPYGVHGLSSSCCTDINIHINLRQVTQGVFVNFSKVKPLVLYAEEHVIAI